MSIKKTHIFRGNPLIKKLLEPPIIDTMKVVT
jgi:hypothetical protein